uniref:Putative lipocalin-3 1 n=1 Tax=Amblyomma triste TaxID=251400 RepID=A0A023G436_AMBTT
MWSFAAIVIALLATATLSSGEAAVEQTTTVYRDIKAFLNTTGPILSFSLSTNAVSLCKLDYDIKITDSGTTFNRYLPDVRRTSAVSGRRQHNPETVVSVTGEFYTAQTGETYDAMKTTYSDGSMFTEAIDYESTNSVCAIFSVAARSQQSKRSRLSSAAAAAARTPQRALVTQEFRIRATAVESEQMEECYRELKNLLPSLQTEVTTALIKATTCWNKYELQKSEDEAASGTSQ